MVLFQYSASHLDHWRINRPHRWPFSLRAYSGSQTAQLLTLAPMDGRLLDHGSTLHVLAAANPAGALERAELLVSFSARFGASFGSGKLRCYLLAVLAAAIGGRGVRSAVITQQHPRAAGVFVNAADERSGTGAGLHAGARLT